MKRELEQLRRKVDELEKKLNESEISRQEGADHFFKLFHASSNPMSILTIKESRFIEVNEAFIRLSGFGREMLIDHDADEFSLFANPAQKEFLFHEARETGRASTFELGVLTKAGEARMLLLSADSINVNGEPCILTTAIDTTAQKSEADALRRSEEKYRLLVDNSLQGLAIIQDWRIVYCNNAFAEILGFSVAELLSLLPDGVKALIHDQDQPVLWNRYRDRLAGKPVPSRYEHRATKRDGTEIWMEAYATLMEYGGEPAVQVAYVDITERRQAESFAKETNERLALALQGAGMASFEWNVQTGEVKDDEQWLQNLGYSAGEIEPNVRSRRPLGHPDDEALIGQAFSAHFEGKTPFYETEHRIRHKSGSWRWILDRGKILDRDSSGQPLRVVGIHVDITEHRLAEDRFLQLANEQRAVLNTISMGICYIKNLRAQWINPALANMFGYEISDVQGQDTSIYYSNEEDYRRIEVEGAEQLAKGLVYSTEALMKRKDGSLLWCSIAGQAINARNPEEGSIWVLHDITERRRTEQALRESEEKFRLIAETIDEIFWIFDIDKGCMTYASPGYKRVWGYSPEYFSEQGKSLEDAIHPDDREQVFAALGQMKDGKLIDYEHRIICPDESIRYIWNRAYPIHDEGGRLKQYVGVAQDVTAWKKAEEALRESKEYLNQIINCIGDPLFVKDDQHKFVLMNDAMCEISRIQREDLLGETAFGYLPKDIVAKLLEKEDEVLNSGRECVMEETIPDTQGNTITVMSKKTRFVDKAGNKQIIGLLHDITEYKQLQAQFLQAQKMEAIGVLAGGVAHDFNNLLNIINGYTELMLTDISQEHPLRADLQLVMDAGQRAASLTTQLLAFSRKQIVQLEILNLNHALESMNSMLRRLIGEDIELTFIGQPELGLINADPGQIHQIVMNLVVNSRDAMPQGGKLTIETANIDLDEQYVRGHLAGAAGPYVMLAVSDNGMGMDSETQSHVFEPFFTTKSQGKGTGLGLSTVYGIIKQSHGFIWVYSEPGKGTAFKIYFPRAEYQRPEIRAERKSAHRLQGRESVLVVEDEESVRTLACRILQEQGYAILEASSGNEALAIAQNHAGEIHLVLTDVVMPGIGGGELVSRITAARPGIKALFVSGYTDNAIVNHGTLDPGIAFLQKPFTIGSLARKVREVLDS